MLLAGMLLACSMSFVHASDASQSQLAPVDTSLTSITSSNAEDSIGYSNNGASAELPSAFYDRVNRLACTVHYVELRFNSAQDMDSSMYDIADWITAIINSDEYAGCYRPGFEVFFTAFVSDDTVQIYGQDMSVPPELAASSASGAASSAPSAPPSASSVAPSASSAAPSEEPVKDKHELRRKDLAVLYPRNGTHAGHSVLPSHVSAAPRGQGGVATSSIWMSRSVSSTKTVFVIPTANLVPTDTDLPPTATIDVNHGLENRPLNFPGSPDYNESNHMSVLCTHCSLNGKLSITQGGWRSPSPDGGAPSLGWLNITLTDFADALEVRLQGRSKGIMKFPLYPANDENAPLNIVGISLPGLGKAGLILRPYLAVGWDLASPTTINYCAGNLWQDAPSYIHVDFANLTNNASTFFAHHPLRADDPHATPFRGRSMDALHAYGSMFVRLQMDLTIVFEEETNTTTTSSSSSSSSSSPPTTTDVAAQQPATNPNNKAVAHIRLGWPGVDANFMARPIAEFDMTCYNVSATTRANYSLFHDDDDHRIASNFTAAHSTFVRIRKRDASVATAAFSSAGSVFPWIVDADHLRQLQHGWVQGREEEEEWEDACYVWLEREQRFEEAGYVLRKIKEGLERDDDAAVGKAAANRGGPEENGGEEEGLESGGAMKGVVMPTFVVGLVMAVAALVCF
ncbi:hypothetical protein DIS24_g12516 [Lasiodiplodia hormozganensis]|uniref:Uncharacterized protein n=1 Tax=Lasiodiplodia hormozganensis TaxID=869390 RepID=A0AA39W3M8_9PEZI|nr:hypothetical protein DIS24_g12516 [Lasiodiplodia hormozganensis]